MFIFPDEILLQLPQKGRNIEVEFNTNTAFVSTLKTPTIQNFNYSPSSFRNGDFAIAQYVILLVASLDFD